jgi:hypothetical protein
MTGTYAILGHPVAIAPNVWVQPSLPGVGITASAGELYTITTASLAGATVELQALLGIGNATMIG